MYIIYATSSFFLKIFFFEEEVTVKINVSFHSIFRKFFSDFFVILITLRAQRSKLDLLLYILLFLSEGKQV